MYNRLEEYLNEVAECLGPLPVTRRNEELKEMRQHLLNAVIVNREFGQSEEEATVSAVEQFGMPQELALSLIGAWQREEGLTKRSLWGAAACTSVILFLQYLAMQVVFYHTDFLHFLRTLGPDGAVIAIPWNISLMILPGFMSATFFRKRAVQGTAMGVMISQAISVIYILADHHQQFYRLPSFWLMSAVGGAATILSAWATNRWRQSRRDRRALSAA